MAGNIDCRLYLVTDDYYLNDHGIFRSIELCLQAGVTALQYRAKDRSSRAMLTEAARLKALSAEYKVPLIINDRLDIALAVDADGLHLGQDDLPLAVARKFMAGKIIGVSASCYEEGRDAIRQGADYVGVGPIFPTATKKDAKPACGPDAIKRLRREFPAVCLVAIGGIELANVGAVLAAGADGVAVISAILGSREPAESAGRFARSLSSLSIGRF